MEFSWQELFKEKLEWIGKIAKENQVRLLMHPGQYIVEFSRSGCSRKSGTYPAYHTEFLDLCQMGSECKIILHIGGAYGDKKRQKSVL